MCRRPRPPRLDDHARPNCFGKRISVVHQNCFTWFRTFAVACCLAAGLVGCQSGGVNAVPGIDPDAVIVGLDDVRRITDRDDLTAQPVMDAPPSFQEHSRSPDQCRPVFGLEDAFGNNWSQFRAVTYTAVGGEISTIATVAQGIGIYPSEGMARSEFERLISSVDACAALHARLYGFTLNRLDPSTVSLVFPENSQSVVYRLASSTLIDVVVQGIPRSDQIAETVTHMISERLN